MNQNVKMVRCGRFGFISDELYQYTLEKLISFEEKSNIEGLTSSVYDVLQMAFERSDVQTLVNNSKSEVKVPDEFLQAFRLKTGTVWEANIPYDAALSAVDKELYAMAERYGISEVWK